MSLCQNVQLDAGSRCCRASPPPSPSSESLCSLPRNVSFVLSRTSGAAFPSRSKVKRRIYFTLSTRVRRAEGKGAGAKVLGGVPMRAHDRGGTIDFSNVNRAKTRRYRSKNDSAFLRVTTKYSRYIKQSIVV